MGFKNQIVNSYKSSSCLPSRVYFCICCVTTTTTTTIFIGTHSYSKINYNNENIKSNN